MEKTKYEIPLLGKRQIFNLTFGYFGLNMAFFLQTSQMSRIFQTIGTDPTKLGWFFILPPLAGMIVQPIVGRMSDNTWNRFGRRLPYLIFGAIISALVLILLPNSGSLGFGYGSLTALIFGAVIIMMLDVSSNMCQQPFKMLIGDMVNESQVDRVWSLQNIYSNAGGMLAAILPSLITIIGFSNIAPRGEVPVSVKISFYLGAIIICVTTLYTIMNVKEYNPQDYQQYHGLKKNDIEKSPSFTSLLKNAPSIFWELFTVMLFSFISVQFVWTYSTGALAENVWHTTDPASAGFQSAGNWNGILTFVQSLTGVLWGTLVLAHLKPSRRRIVLFFALILGGIGLIMMSFISSKILTIVPFSLFGIMYITIGTEAFAMITSAIKGANEGAYLGLFNWQICIPQIVASVASFAIFPMVHKSMSAMMLIAGISALMAAVMMKFVKKVEN
ncbi:MULTISPECIES: SLC45 family MFS transporter [Fructobacillus]|jgi:maltose/moltooligosaccharide transporter|uniref:Na+/melibiose symporter or related transporter (MelB) n=1 Tax=Fructobacillus cardui TaxID=2893170 RepID=A0ABN9YMM6_9LACO|nr:SLC45 family MFS transporter [Fructobacillus sp. EFB-N1]KMK53146.1 Inner membrane symporter YicJ [Fructobacillus sp. EFB-N1]CAK1232977.1 Na+/melibiose symporter or related transporter (MelB) [Fructobacillus cardui]CAK1236631.1 Na+/melibiose symporter or related transporter (MelB) [Fructobacillus cardui]